MEPTCKVSMFAGSVAYEIHVCECSSSSSASEFMRCPASHLDTRQPLLRSCGAHPGLTPLPGIPVCKRGSGGGRPRSTPAERAGVSRSTALVSRSGPRRPGLPRLSPEDRSHHTSTKRVSNPASLSVRIRYVHFRRSDSQRGQLIPRLR